MRRLYLIVAAIVLLVAVFPTPHDKVVILTKTLLIDTSGIFMYAVHPGMDEKHELTDLKREAGFNQRHKFKLYVSSTEVVRVTATTSFGTQYDKLDKVHNYEFYSEETSYLLVSVNNPLVGGSGKTAQVIGQIDVYFEYQEPSTEQAGWLPWWMP